MTHDSFHTIAKQSEIEILQIIRDGTAIAKGIHIPKAVTSLDDNGKSAISYSDTGVFILFCGSNAFSPEEKYKSYIDKSGKTTREIIFQSRNAAAQFVLGKQGRTNCWEKLTLE